MNLGTERDLMYIIAEGTGSMPGPMERAIAAKILSYFQERGWASTEEVAYIVKAAGGKVVISEKLLRESAPLLQWTRDPVTDDLIIRVRQEISIEDAEELIKNAKVNPNAESRTVDSGPVNVKPTRN